MEVIKVKWGKQISMVLATMLLATIATAQTNSTALIVARDQICNTLQSIYDLLLYIASGLGAVMIVVMGIAWITSAEDSKSRTRAKEAVIHVIVGLIIVSIAVVLVQMVLPEGSDCIDDWA